VSNVPDRRRNEPAAPERLSSEEFELVIRRAAELQARSTEEPGADGITEADALRIGRELGLSDAHLGRALAEVRGGTAEEHGVMAGLMGRARLSAARTMNGTASAIARTLESHLVGRQYLVVQRRLPDRTVFVEASGVVAAIERTTTELFRSTPLLGVANLEVAVRQIEPRISYVVLSTDLRGTRAGYAAGGGALGGVMGGTAALALGLAVTPPAALVGAPILAAVFAGMRWAYRSEAEKTAVKLESLLDRLEHGELEHDR
jgi:hypothetical protein